MEQNKMFKQMIDFNKTAYDNSFGAMVMVQEQTEKMVGGMLEQATWLPEEGKKAITEWSGACKKGAEDFKKAVDDNFGKMKNFFASTKQ
jgi:hypothetical protein